MTMTPEERAVLLIACAVTGAEASQVMSTTRSSVRAAYARHIMMTLLRTEQNYSLRKTRNVMGRDIRTIKSALIEIEGDRAEPGVDAAITRLAEIAAQIAPLVREIGTLADAFEAEHQKIGAQP